MLLPWFAIGCTLTVLSTALLLRMEQKDSLAGRWLTKPVASLGFVVAGLGGGLLGSAPGRWLLAGLVLSLVGDVALIPRSSKTFLAGLGSFLLGHVAFAVAFIVRGVAPAPALVALAAAGAGTLLVLRWLHPHLTPAFRAPVVVYVVVITCMVALAVGTHAVAPAPALLAGAVLFAASDVSVARDQFVERSFVNRAWGLPLYYLAQLLLASGA